MCKMYAHATSRGFSATDSDRQGEKNLRKRGSFKPGVEE